MAKFLSRAPSSARLYTEFEPRSEWLEGEESDTLLVDLSGFKKEQLKVTISTSGSLKISGERPIEGKQWVRFLKYFTVPKRSNPTGIQAKFDKEEGLLYVVLPKIGSQRNNSRNHTQTQTQSPLSGSNATANGRNDAPIPPSRPATMSNEIAGGGNAQNSTQGRSGGTVMGFSKRKILLVNAALIFTVLVGVGVYLICKLRIHRGKESS